MTELIIDADAAGKRLDKYLSGRFRGLGIGRINKELRQRGITVNRKKTPADYRLQQGDVIRLYCEVPSQQQSDPALTQYAEARARFGSRISVLYEDADVMIIDKPAGILSQKAAPEDLSINEWFIGLMLERGEATAESLVSFRPSVCNRLDRNTSGCLICGRTLSGSRRMGACIREHRLQKYYLALVHGNVTAPATLRGALLKDEKKNAVRLVDEGKERDHQSGRMAEAYLGYRPISRCADDQITLLEVQLFTGRTHQIRAQLAAAGFPILFDPKYGDRAADRRLLRRHGAMANAPNRQLLHCSRLVFPEDAQLKDLSGREIRCDCPGDMKQWYQNVKGENQ